MRGVTTGTHGWEFDLRDLRELRVGFHDGLIVGLLPEPLGTSTDTAGQDMVLCEVMDVAADVMVGASLGVVQLSTVGMVMLHRRFTPLVQSQVAWAVGTRLRRQRLVAGTDPRVVMTGARPPADLVPEGIRFADHPVRLWEDGSVRLVQVWEVIIPPWILGGETFPA